MKARYLFYLTIIVISVSCIGINERPSTFQRVEKKGYEVGINRVIDYIQDSRGINPTKTASISIEPMVCNGDTVMYLVNYQDGWELLSGDLRASRVLASCCGSNITTDDLFSSPSQIAYMNALEENLSKAIHDDDFYSNIDVKDSWLPYHREREQIDRGGPSLDNRVVRVLDSIKRSTVTQWKRDHLLPTKWGQGYPWNASAPYNSPTLTNHCLTGCVPVAAAQVLYYLHNKFGVPSVVYGNATCSAYLQNSSDSLVLSSSDISFGSLSSTHWGSMPLDNTGTSGFDKVSALMMRLGYLYGAKYKVNSTSAVTSLATTVFPTEFSISCDKAYIYSNSSLNSVASSQIYSQSLPMIMSVSYTDSSNHYHGHSIVLDGYRYLEELVTYYYSYYITGPNGIIMPWQQPDSHDTQTETETSYCVAINWGWDGYGDSDSLGNTIWYNIFTNWVVSTYEYTDKNYIIFHFSPTV